MTSRNSTDWMWAQACALIDEAERMHRQFFRLGVSERTQAVWEPPVDVFEDDREVVVVVALPGVAAECVEVTMEPVRWSCAPRRDSPSPARRHVVRRLEIPYGYFERRIPLPVRGARGRHARVGERLPRAAAAQIDRRREIMNERIGCRNAARQRGREPSPRRSRRGRAARASGRGARAARRRAHHRAGAQRRAVSRHGAAAHRGSRALARRGARGRAAAAAARRAAAEQSRGRGTGSRRPALGRHDGQRAALHHGSRRRAPRDLPGREALSRPAVPRRLSVHGRAGRDHRPARAHRSRHRRSRACAQAARARDAATAAAGARGGRRGALRRIAARRASPTSSRA